MTEGVGNSSDIIGFFNDIIDEKEENNYKYSEEEVLKILIQLVQNNFIHQKMVNFNMPKDDLFDVNENHTIQTFNTKRKAKPKTKKLEKKTKLNKESTNLVLFDNIPKELLLLADDGIPNHLNFNSIQKKEEISNNNIEINNKSHSLLFDSISNKEYNLTINFRQFIHEIRSNIIIECIQEKINIQSATIVQAFLKNSKAISKAFEVKATEFLTVDQILQILPSHLKIDSNVLTSFLEVLKNDNGHFIKENLILENSFNIKKYAIDLQNIIRNLQIKTYEKILDKTYTPHYSRIFRIVLRFQSAEEKKIREASMLPLNECRAILSELLKENIIQYEELIDNKGLKLSVYSIKLRIVFDKLQTNLQKAIFNLKIQKLKFEEKLNEQSKILNYKEKEEILLKIRKFESAILETDSTLMLFSEF